MDLARQLADTLRRLREEASVSQVEMARVLRISRATLNRLENAVQNATLRTLGELCRALRCQPGDLFEPGRLKAPAGSAFRSSPPGSSRSRMLAAEPRAPARAARYPVAPKRRSRRRT